VGLLGLIGIKVLAPGFYARQDIRTPVKIAVVVLVLTQLMNLLFVPRFGHAGLALSIGLGALINAGWLLFGLRRQGTYVPQAGWLGFGWRVLCASAVLGAALAVAATGIDWVGLGTQRWLRIGLLAACLIGVASLYFATLWLMGIRLKDFTRRG
jgi:putative peptidoglycan lipid II flippase